MQHISGVGARIIAGAALGLASPAIAGGTTAGTRIDNQATASYDGPGGTVTVPSNTVSLTVDELLDVTVVSADPGDVQAIPGSADRVLTFTVTNTGNGDEAFGLASAGTLGGDDFDPAVTAIVLDSNGNGAYDAGVDTVYVAGGNDPLLAPDASVTVFLLSTIPGGAGDGHRGRAQLSAEASTGSGAPGASFAGQGQGGGNAIVGATGADADASGFYAVSAATVGFVKSATVADPFGGTSAVPGSVITYSLVATVSGTGTLGNLAIADAIPAGSSYRPGTLTLQGAALTDAADGDAGELASGAIAVRLGNVAGGQVRTVTFQVQVD
ncbi:hypothetical protein D1610_15970 [Sphingomonas gilva]|uniref:DUF11 domain-containing protein n=1 Tax=Sphingomonas gilva TaxID=2305907 RepID=A0A396RZ08_9SPHN|nr:hypothetical protein [Sphingomonas gilva]RHW16335.1 hypothetical protein D1610_15970 [Sphingomonas gilva]